MPPSLRSRPSPCPPAAVAWHSLVYGGSARKKKGNNKRNKRKIAGRAVTKRDDVKVKVKVDTRKMEEARLDKTWSLPTENVAPTQEKCTQGQEWHEGIPINEETPRTSSQGTTSDLSFLSHDEDETLFHDLDVAFIVDSIQSGEFDSLLDTEMLEEGIPAGEETSVSNNENEEGIVIPRDFDGSISSSGLTSTIISPPPEEDTEIVQVQEQICFFFNQDVVCTLVPRPDIRDTAQSSRAESIKRGCQDSTAVPYTTTYNVPPEQFTKVLKMPAPDNQVRKNETPVLVNVKSGEEECQGERFPYDIDWSQVFPADKCLGHLSLSQLEAFNVAGRAELLRMELEMRYLSDLSKINAAVGRCYSPNYGPLE